MDDAKATRAFNALAHEARLRAFRQLVEAGPEGLPSGEIAERLGIAPTAMSFHLTALDRAGLVRSWRDGRRIRYSVEFGVVSDLLLFITHSCCGGHPELCGNLGAGLLEGVSPDRN